MNSDSVYKILLKQKSILGMPYNIILFDDLITPEGFDKQYAVVQPFLFKFEDVLFDVIIATTNMIVKDISSTYYIAIVSDKDLSSIHRSDIWAAYGVSSSFLFSRKKNSYPDLILTNSYGFYSKPYEYRVFSLEEFGLNYSDLKSIEHILKTYS